MNEVTAGRLQLIFQGNPALGLETLPGIGPKTKKRLHDRGIIDQAELLLFIPRKYRPVYRHCPVADLIDKPTCYAEFIGEIVHISSPRPHSRAPFELTVHYQNKPFRILWFNYNAASFKRRFQPGSWIHLEGQVDLQRNLPTITHPASYKVFHDGCPPIPDATIGVEPVYSSMEGIANATLEKAIAHAADTLCPLLHDIVPPIIRQRHGFIDIQTALEIIHLRQPFNDLETFKQRLQDARDRLVYEEFYTLQRQMTQSYIEERRTARAPACTQRELGRSLVRQLPFALTSDQSKAIARIADDLKTPVPMRRLLQGDVGSGKTVVAFMAAAIAINNGQQVAFMAPTDILAKQHLRRALSFFKGLDLQIALLSGSARPSERKELLSQLENGVIDLLIGTHALFQDDILFKNLGFVIVDEQHKFGVEQRQRLLEKGNDPHLLAMTATPIPRSLAHAVFGDLDLTVIREKPPGRKPIRTVLRNRSRAPKVYDYVRQRILETREQAYFVYPMVEASDAVTNRLNVIEAAQELANGPLASLRVGVLHGRMDNEAKDAVMQRFTHGEIDVLCATTVVEVGVDVPNATMMVIESAEVFGLSQLHQLRGRIGRGDQASMCILLAGYGITEDAQERLLAFSSTDDGFALAETDLRIRGPGQLLGVRQAGLAEFRFGDLLRDAHLLDLARQDVRLQLLGDVAT